MSHTCGHCGAPCIASPTKLSEWEIRELQGRAARVIVEFPRLRGSETVHVAGRQSHLKALADEYGINIRTLYRYMRRAA